MSAYLFVHFKEKTTPDAEQVYFGISEDGFHWHDLNGEQPVLWNYVGTHGTRDFTIVRHPKTGKKVILGTDLSISYLSRRLRPGFWQKVGTQGSSCLVRWESEDLTHWSESELIDMDPQKKHGFGCVWAPDAVWDGKREEFLVHWSSSDASDSYAKKRIWGAYTADFRTFGEPFVLLEEPESDIIDSAVYAENGAYYLFAKAGKRCGIRLYRSEELTGDYCRVKAFDECVGDVLEEGLYEAPTAVRLDDGRWCLFIDYYGARGLKQGYVPFVSDSLESGVFRRADADFDFPYGYKHGTILKITGTEYERLKNYDWSDKGYGPDAF